MLVSARVENGVGLLLHALATGKASEVGRIIFFCVFLAVCLQVAPHLHSLR